MMKETITIKITPNNSYKKHYKMHKVGRWYSSYEVSVPGEIVKRCASQADMAPEDFIKEHKVEWVFDNFDGAYMRFIKDGNGNTQT